MSLEARHAKCDRIRASLTESENKHPLDLLDVQFRWLSTFAPMIYGAEFYARNREAILSYNKWDDINVDFFVLQPHAMDDVARAMDRLIDAILDEVFTKKSLRV
jgi:hypothetical protein